MAHLYSAYTCNFCHEIPDEPPLFSCTKAHIYCMNCFKSILCDHWVNQDCAKKDFFCIFCKFVTQFQQVNVNDQLLKKLKSRPGIGRPRRYNVNRNFAVHSDEKVNNQSISQISDQSLQIRKIVDVSQSVFKNQDLEGRCSSIWSSSALCSINNISKRPLICLHNNCKKSIAISSLLTHFKHDHADVPKFSLDKRKELLFSFNVYIIEHGHTLCLAMITLYENNEIDVKQSRSSRSVINTCTKLSGKVPVDTFWLMVSSSNNNTKSSSYVAFWLYSNCDDEYCCTIKLSSKNDKIFVSSYGATIGMRDCNVKDVIHSLNCLFVNYGTFLSILSEADDVNLSLIIH